MSTETLQVKCTAFPVCSSIDTVFIDTVLQQVRVDYLVISN